MILGGQGVALVLLMISFLNHDTSGLSSFTALALVFSIRFSVTYAAEFSRHVGRILQQRVVIDKVINISFR